MTLDIEQYEDPAATLMDALSRDGGCEIAILRTKPDLHNAVDRALTLIRLAANRLGVKPEVTLIKDVLEIRVVAVIREEAVNDSHRS